MLNLTFTLRGLSCVNCAAEIQDEVKLLEWVDSAELTFATQKLFVIAKDNTDMSKVISDINKVIKDIESGVTADLINEKNLKNLPLKEKLNSSLIFLILGGILFIIGLVLKLPLWLRYSILGASYLISGSDVLYKAIRNILKGKFFDENLLMSIATLGALALKEFPEAAAVMLFYKIGQSFENLAVNSSIKSIQSLMQIRPDYANLKTGSEVKKVDPNEVKPGDIVIIKSGEKVPLDCVVVDGTSTIDNSSITGESKLFKIKPGEYIYSGSINISGILTAEVAKSYEDSTVSKILDLVQNAASKKAPAEKFISRFASYYTPIVVLAAFFIAILPPIITGNLEFSKWIGRALIFLVISCPCALVISIPLSFFGGLGCASKRGILIKGSNYLEALKDVNTVIFDKTGTLTKGVFKVTEIKTSNGYSEYELLEFAALAEANSSHPIASSILEAFLSGTGSAFSLNQLCSRTTDFKELPGYGISAVLDGKQILAGNDKLMHIRNDIFHETCNVTGTVIHVAVDNIYAGYILISDEIKEDARKTISQIREFGDIRVVMLTGDSEQSARSVANKLRIDEFYFGLLPHQKVEKMQSIRESTFNPRLAFIGDGINDAPVLANADIGVSMGGLGSNAAIEASDVVLMTDELSKFIDALKISRKTRNIVWQTIFLAIFVKIVVMILGTVGFATMWEAVFADVGVTLIAVFNALRILNHKGI